MSPPSIINHFASLIQQFALRFDQHQVETMPFVRTITANSDHLNSCDGARITHWQTPRSGNSVLEIQTYPDSSKVTKAQRAQLGRNFQDISDTFNSWYSQIHPPIGTGIKKSISLLHKGALNTPLLLCQSL